ncbi:MAG TPA: ferredoxin [Amycolatopsis sp.]|nr:ferredoxin [Amycolatopsis sp.]
MSSDAERREGRLQVSIRPDQCAGSGLCRSAAPAVFGHDEHGWVDLLDAHPPAHLLDEVLDAKDACPLAVIKVHDENGNPID